MNKVNTEKKITTDNNVVNLNKIFNKQTIVRILLGLSVLLVYIGLFGAMLATTTETAVGSGALTVNKTNMGLKYIFVDLIETIKRLKLTMSTDSEKGVVNFLTSEAIVLMVSFFTALIVSIICIVLATRNFSNKKPVNINRLFALFIVSIVQYPVIYKLVNFTRFSDYRYSRGILYYSDCQFGWGAILIFIALALGIVALLINKTDKVNKLFNASSIASIIAFVSIFFVALIGVSNQITCTYVVNQGDNAITASYSVYSWLLDFTTNKTGAQSDGIINFLSIFALCSQLLVAVPSLLLFVYSIFQKDDKKQNIKRIIFSSLFVVFSIASVVLLQLAIFKSTYSESSRCFVNFTAAEISTIIFGLLMVICSISSMIFKDKPINFNLKFLKKKSK